MTAKTAAVHEARDAAAVIRASEIAQYAYCRRAWWLRRVRGYEPDNPGVLDEGRDYHARHGESVAAALRWQQAGYILLGIGILVGLGGLWLASGSGW
jgi:CRISPR/Cas system-associated exonuclease Cas4 (RecB family)